MLAEELVASRNFHNPQHPQCVTPATAPAALLDFSRQNRYMDENRQDSVDIHPRRFEPGICARNYVEDAQQGDSQQQQQEQQQLQQLEEEAWDEE